MPIHMRMRKLRGPHMKKSMPFEQFRTHTQPVNLADLEARFDDGAEVTPRRCASAGLATRKGVPVKVLGQGELARSSPSARTASRKTAREKIEAAGGACSIARRANRRGRSDRHLVNAFRIPDIRKKIAFTAAMLALYRLGAYIPAPGINTRRGQADLEQFAGSNVLGFLNLFSGGSLQRFAIFALGIMPYITASIILQLLQVVVPSLEKLRKEGEVGQQKITQYTRYLTVGLAFAQSIGYVFLFRTLRRRAGSSVLENFTFGGVFLIVLTLTAGTVLLMWLGELITQRGIGNGISLMIFA